MAIFPSKIFSKSEGLYSFAGSVHVALGHHHNYDQRRQPGKYHQVSAKPLFPLRLGRAVAALAAQHTGHQHQRHGQQVREEEENEDTEDHVFSKPNLSNAY